MYKIAIVDDNWEICELFKVILENLEIFKVISFDHGSSFKEYLYEGNSLDIAIIDLDLPDTTGYELINFLRTNNYKYLPIIVITAYEDFNHKVKALELGADDYIVKPINIFEIILKINNYLKKKKYIEEIINREAVIKEKAELIYLLETFLVDNIIPEEEKFKNNIKKYRDENKNIDKSFINELINDLDIFSDKVKKLLVITRSKKEIIKSKKQKLHTFKDIEETFNMALKKSKDRIINDE